MEACIDPPGNEGSLCKGQNSYFSICSQVGMSISISITSLFSWRLSKVDVKSAFLYTGHSDIDVYVVLPTWIHDRGSFPWLLSTAASDLFNANGKWKFHSYTMLLDFGFFKAPPLPQVLVILYNFRVVVILSKIIDNRFFAVPPSSKT